MLIMRIQSCFNKKTNSVYLPNYLAYQIFLYAPAYILINCLVTNFAAVLKII